MVTIGILIGGESRRMGRPKALVRVDGVTLIERTADIASSVADDLVLLGVPPFELPVGVASLPVFADLNAGIGPMAGLESLLAARSGGPSLLLACDMPRLTPTLLLRLCEGPRDCDATVACTVGSGRERLHPCCALYQPSVLTAVRTAVSAGRFGMLRLLDGLRVQRVALAGAEAAWVENWNEPGDLPGAGKSGGRS